MTRSSWELHQPFSIRSAHLSNGTLWPGSGVGWLVWLENNWIRLIQTVSQNNSWQPWHRRRWNDQRKFRSFCFQSWYSACQHFSLSYITSTTWLWRALSGTIPPSSLSQSYLASYCSLLSKNSQTSPFTWTSTVHTKKSMTQCNGKGQEKERFSIPLLDLWRCV